MEDFVRYFYDVSIKISLKSMWKAFSQTSLQIPAFHCYNSTLVGVQYLKGGMPPRNMQISMKFANTWAWPTKGNSLQMGPPG